MISFGKKIFFSTTTVLLILGLLELVLKQFSAFQCPHLVLEHVRNDGTVECSLNADIGKRFFKKKIGKTNIQMPRIFPDTFLKNKPADEFRVFVLGGSTVQGYPYPYMVAFPSLLESILNARYSNRKFKVLNCGLTALNSFALIDLVEELMNYSPDLIILYTGHNEFYGVYGSGAVQSFSRNRTITRLFMKLEQTAIYQLIQRLTERIPHSGKEPVKGLIEVMVKDKSIPLNSEIFKKTMSNFRENIDEIFHITAKHHVPTVICTVTSNIAGLSPISAPTGKNKHRLKKLKTDASQSLESGDFSTALKTAQELINDFPDNAWGYFLAGRAELGLDQRREACKNFKMAADLDGLRFRAPTELNRIIREFGTIKSEPVIDVETAFASYSRQACPGYDLFVDHVHPTDYGHFVIADIIAHALPDFDFFPNRKVEIQSKWPTWEQIRDLTMYTDIEQIFSLMQVASLYQHYPLQTLPEAGMLIQKTKEEVNRLYAGLPDVMKTVFNRWAQSKDKFDIHFEAGKIYLKSGDIDAALHEFKAAQVGHPDSELIRDYIRKARALLGGKR